MKDRIKQLMESLHMTQQTFAELIGISAGSLSSIFSERTQPTLKIVDAIKSKFPNLNTDWLMYGIEPMYKDESSKKSNNEVLNSIESLEKTPTFKGPSMPPPLLFSDEEDQDFTSKDSQKAVRTEVKYIDKPKRSITEIRIFFDDQTWETFVPKK